MTFGRDARRATRGILAEPRRGECYESARTALFAPFQEVISRTAPGASALVVVPDGTPPFRGVEDYENDPLGLVEPLEPTQPQRTARTLTSDARDLLIKTLHRRLAIQLPGDPRSLTGPVLPTVVEAPLPSSSPAGPKLIHIGETRQAKTLLETMRPLVRSLSDWSGYLEDLDGDGFIVISLQQAGTRHLLLVGGSDRGTFYAVTWFLEVFAGVQWFFPGRLGTVIPAAADLTLGAVINHIEEPDYRGRTLGGVIHNQRTIQEVNETRNWLLRNRLHPTDERSLICQKVYYRSGALSCESPNPAHLLLLGDEARIPTNHNLGHFFSPHSITFDFSQFRAGRFSRFDAVPEMFPDLRPRQIPAVALPGDQPALDRQKTLCVGVSLVLCDTSSSACCPEEEGNLFPVQRPWPENQPVSLQVEVDPAGVTPPRCNAPEFPGSVAVLQARFAQAIPSQEDERNLRFIPRSFKHTIFQDSRPLGGFFPCVYVSSSTPPPALTSAPFRRTVAIDLANQLVLAILYQAYVRGSAEPEFCETLAPDDTLSGYWCECLACRLSNGLDGPNDAAILHRGHVVIPSYTVFEPAPGLGESDWFTASEAQQVLRAFRAYAALQNSLRALSEQAVGRELLDALGLTGLEVATSVTGEQNAILDRMALRGIINDRTRLNRHTRRILDLYNETARVIAAQGGNPYLPQFFRGENPVQSDHVLLTFHAYEDFLSPPVFTRDPITQPDAFYDPAQSVGVPRSSKSHIKADETLLHPMLTPIVVSSRDTGEYDPLGRFPDEAFRQLRQAADQFNLRRWSLIAHQTGFYEYFWGAGYFIPRTYSRRLQVALQRGYEQMRTRVFVAECNPHYGLDANKYYEVAKVLWDRNSFVTGQLPAETESVRGRFCRGLFGLPGGNFAVANAMKSYFDELENLWASRDPLEQRFRGDYGNFQGMGIVGRSGWITQLDPFILRPRSGGGFEVPGRMEEMPFWSAWGHLQAAWSMSPAETLVRERVRFFRRSFGLTKTLIEVYAPVLREWLKVVQDENGQRRIAMTENDPLAWAGRIAYDRDENLLVPGWFATVGSALALTNWQTAAGFRDRVREPVHRYLLNNNLDEELGLGLGQFGTMITPGRDRTLELALNSEDPVVRWAFTTWVIQKYTEWWNGNATWAGRQQDRAGVDGVDAVLVRLRRAPLEPRSPLVFRRVERSISEEKARRENWGSIDEDWFGTWIFWTIKKFVASMLFVKDQSNEQIGLIVRFLLNA